MVLLLPLLSELVRIEDTRAPVHRCNHIVPPLNRVAILTHRVNSNVMLPVSSPGKRTAMDDAKLGHDMSPRESFVEDEDEFKADTCVLDMRGTLKCGEEPERESELPGLVGRYPLL